MEVQWQLPFISKAVTVNKYDGARLSQRSSDKEPHGCPSWTHMVHFCLKIRMEKKTGRGGSRVQDVLIFVGLQKRLEMRNL